MHVFAGFFNSNFVHFNLLKGKDTRGCTYRGYPPAAGCIWLSVDFDEGGNPENAEKNSHNQTEID